MSIIERDLRDRGLAADDWGGAEADVEARGYWEQVWRRFKRDKVAIGGGVTIILLLLLCFVGGAGVRVDPRAWPEPALRRRPEREGAAVGAVVALQGRAVHRGDRELPARCSSRSAVTAPQGRDEFLRLLYGGQASLEVAILATVFTILIGATVGSIAGYFGGVVDTIVSRLTELVMAFPVLLFIIALASVVGPAAERHHLRLPRTRRLHDHDGAHDLRLVLPGAHRAGAGAVAAREGVHRGRAHGRRERLADHPLAPAAAPRRADDRARDDLGRRRTSWPRRGCRSSASGSRIRPSSWGTLLSEAPQFYLQVPWLMIWPGLAVLITTLSFNLLGDGLRDAVDPRGAR